MAFQGPDGDPPAPQVDDLAATLAAEFTGLIRPRLERCFEDLDGDEEELMDRLRSSYREWKSPRIIEVTRHHVLAAFSRGQFDAMPEGAAVAVGGRPERPGLLRRRGQLAGRHDHQGRGVPDRPPLPAGPRRVPVPDRPRGGARQGLTALAGPNAGVATAVSRLARDASPLGHAAAPPRRRRARRGRRLPSGRGRVVLIVALVALFVLATSMRGIAGFYTDYLWFDSLGLAGIWRGVLGAKTALALIFIGIFFVLMWANLFIADRIAPDVPAGVRPRGRPGRALPRAGRHAGRACCAPGCRSLVALDRRVGRVGAVEGLDPLHQPRRLRR